VLLPSGTDSKYVICGHKPVFHRYFVYYTKSENYQSGKKADWEGPLCKFAAHKKMLIFFGLLLIFCVSFFPVCFYTCYCHDSSLNADDNINITSTQNYLTGMFGFVRPKYCEKTY